MRAPVRQAQRHSRLPGREATSVFRRQHLTAHLANATVVIAKQENVCRPMRKYTDCDDARDAVNPGFHLQRIGDL